MLGSKTLGNRSQILEAATIAYWPLRGRGRIDAMATDQNVIGVAGPRTRLARSVQLNLALVSAVRRSPIDFWGTAGP
jgi:hypothetical protein